MIESEYHHFVIVTITHTRKELSKYYVAPDSIHTTLSIL